MTAPKNVKALETGSGVTWEEWLQFLEPHKTLDHTAMAKVVYDKIMQTGRAHSPEWWAQGVTVAYEQYIGRRKPGQRSDGKFSVTVSRTLPGTMDDVLAQWVSQIKNEVVFNSVKIKSPGEISASKQWRYWRCALADGSRVSVNMQTKPNGEKSLLAINHDGIPAANQVEPWRKFWKSYSIKQ